MPFQASNDSFESMPMIRFIFVMIGGSGYRVLWASRPTADRSLLAPFRRSPSRRCRLGLR